MTDYKELPLKMGDEPIGWMDLNADGTFSGKLRPELAEILAEGLAEMFQVGFYGRPGINAILAQAKLNELITGIPTAETIAEHFYGKVEYVEVATTFLKKYEVKERKPSGTESDPIVHP